MNKIAPLSSSFMLFAMLGFMITIVYTAYGRIDETWGFTFGFVFALMFVAAMVSMTKAPLNDQIKADKSFLKPLEESIKKTVRRKKSTKTKKSKK